jgi:hypothetical protein
VGSHFSGSENEIINWGKDTVFYIGRVSQWGRHRYFSLYLCYLRYKTDCYRAFNPVSLPANYTPLARLSLDKNFANHVTSLALFPCGLKAIASLNGANSEGGPFGSGLMLARYLKRFTVFRELQVAITPSYHSRCRGRYRWRPSFKSVPFRLCNGEDMCRDCVWLAQGLDRIGDLAWVIRGIESEPVVKFVCLLREDLSGYANIEGVEP